MYLIDFSCYYIIFFEMCVVQPGENICRVGNEKIHLKKEVKIVVLR